MTTFGIDPEILTSTVSFDNGSASIHSYLARPAEVGRAPGVLVVHARYGLEPHFRDLARRLARLGFVTIAPDLLSPFGGTNSYPDHLAAAGALETRDLGSKVEDLQCCLEWLAERDDVDHERLAVLGFCAGGTLTWRLATKEPKLRAAIPFYGANPPLEDVSTISAPILGIYAGLDDRINAGIPEITEAMAKAGKLFEKEIYEGARHGFHNDQNHNGNYHQEAATAAWRRTIEWLDRWLAPMPPRSATSSNALVRP